MSGDMPMPPDRYQELVRTRELAHRPDPLLAVERRDPATATSALAAELLAEAAARPLASGELLLLCEEATLDDLEAAAASVVPATGAPTLNDTDPMLAMVTLPRLLSPRVDEVLGWQPPLAEVSRLLEGALQAGFDLPLTMLVGHVETFPERVEHLMRLRHLIEAGRGTVVLQVALAADADLPSRDRRIVRVAQAARPADPELERRHTLALAALALGDGIVLP